MTPAPEFPLPDPRDPLASVWVGNLRLLSAVNAARDRAGLRRYGFARGLARIAGRQAEWWARGETTDVREAECWTRLGVVAHRAVAVGLRVVPPDAAEVVDCWLGREGSRPAVLASGPTHAGFGWAYGADGTLVVVGAMGKR